MYYGNIQWKEVREAILISDEVDFREKLKLSWIKWLLYIDKVTAHYLDILAHWT